MYSTNITKRPLIITNAADSLSYVTIRAAVLVRFDSTSPVTFDPYRLVITQIGNSIVDEAEFSITNISDQAVGISQVDWPPDYFDVDLPDALKPGHTYQATVKLKPDVIERSFEKSFTIEATTKSTYRFTIPVKRNYSSAAT